jgi:hypothetical protein
MNTLEKRAHVSLARVVGELRRRRVHRLVLPTVVARHVFAVSGVDHSELRGADEVELKLNASF